MAFRYILELWIYSNFYTNTTRGTVDSKDSAGIWIIYTLLVGHPTSHYKYNNVIKSRKSFQFKRFNKISAALPFSSLNSTQLRVHREHKGSAFEILRTV